jgi:hypothetical protein
MKLNDFLLNLFAAAAFLSLGFIGGYVYAQKQAIERAQETLKKTNYEPNDLRYIAVGAKN